MYGQVHYYLHVLTGPFVLQATASLGGQGRTTCWIGALLGPLWTSGLGMLQKSTLLGTDSANMLKFAPRPIYAVAAVLIVFEANGSQLSRQLGDPALLLNDTNWLSSGLLWHFGPGGALSAPML